MERKAIPPTTCDYMMRMHMKSMTAISSYMSAGCLSRGMRSPQMVCVELINLRSCINKILEEYSK